jgi:signal transduction histidine kinase
MLTDVTDRIRLEEARERFIGILGHDLRTPLNAIMMGIELLGELAKPEADVVARMGRSAHRMEAMIRDILDFARGRLGAGIPVAPRSNDLGRVCRDVVEEIKLAYPAREMHFEAVGELRGQWDRERIEQVLSNLLGNAIKHGIGPITVMARDEGAVVVTTIHNRGTPIPAALIPTVFEPFTGTSHGGHGGPPAGGQGLGLGLYIASEIVRAHAGTITVSSTADEGTIFEIRWPRRGGFEEAGAATVSKRSTA